MGEGDNTDIRISAIVATRNRAPYLRKALQSLVAQTLPSELYEIIVVDNGSEDETKSVVDEFSAAPNLRYIYEPIAGCSRARNKGWHNARGEYIAFLDDDAIACPEWLALYLNAFDKFGSDLGLIGGRVELIWEMPKPDWLLDDRLGELSVYRYSGTPVVLNEAQVLSICNLACPRKVLDEVMGLREDLGKTGSVPLAHAEWALKRELDSRGFRSLYHPDILVHHHIPASRMTKRWFRQRAYWSALSEAVMYNPHGRLSTVTRVEMAIKRIGWVLPRLLIGLVTIDPGYRFKREIQVREAAGYVAGLLKGMPETVT